MDEERAKQESLKNNKLYFSDSNGKIWKNGNIIDPSNIKPEEKKLIKKAPPVSIVEPNKDTATDEEIQIHRTQAREIGDAIQKQASEDYNAAGINQDVYLDAYTKMVMDGRKAQGWKGGGKVNLPGGGYYENGKYYLPESFSEGVITGSKGKTVATVKTPEQYADMIARVEGKNAYGKDLKVWDKWGEGTNPVKTTEETNNEEEQIYKPGNSNLKTIVGEEPKSVTTGIDKKITESEIHTDYGSEEFALTPEEENLDLEEDAANVDFSIYDNDRQVRQAQRDLGWTQSEIDAWSANNKKYGIKEDISIYDKMRDATSKSAMVGAVPEVFGLALNTADLINNQNEDFEPMEYQDSRNIQRVEAPNIYDPARRENQRQVAATTRQLRESGNTEQLAGVAANAMNADLDARTKQAALDLDAKNKTTQINAQERAASDKMKFQADAMNDTNYRKWLQEKQLMDSLGKNAIYKGVTNLGQAYNNFLATNISTDMQEDLAMKSKEDVNILN